MAKINLKVLYAVMENGVTMVTSDVYRSASGTAL